MKKAFMFLMVLGLAAAFYGTFFFAACGSEEKGGDGGSDASVGSFGSICQNGGDCVSLVCWKFGAQKQCTIKCLSNSDCPTGSLGKLCNNDGYCVP